MFLFQKNHILMIQQRKKTQTRRLHKKFRARIGSVHQCRTELFGPSHCKIRILRRWWERLGDINYADAHYEGGYSPEDYINGMIEMHKGKVNVNTVLACYEFELIRGLKKGQTYRHGTVFCKTEGYPYLGIGPDSKCPVCGHKGENHVHANGASWCRICTKEARS